MLRQMPACASRYSPTTPTAESDKTHSPACCTKRSPPIVTVRGLFAMNTQKWRCRLLADRVGIVSYANPDEATVAEATMSPTDATRKNNLAPGRYCGPSVEYAIARLSSGSVRQ